MATRNALLDAAEFAARSRGFDAFSYADLARAVGIRKASIHHHFPTKADLALAVIQRYRENFAQRLLQIRGKNSSAGTQLLAFLQTYRDALGGGNTVCLCVAFSAGRDSFDEAVLGELHGFHTDSIQWLEETFLLAGNDGSIIAAVESSVEAPACLALVEGAQLMARAAKDVCCFDSAVAGLRRRAL
jgi:TetR/AcrR family transcriptional repressor of nem operon